MTADFLVIGAGVAGLRAAIELSRAGEVLVVAKDTLQESSSEYAQGGIAVAIGEDDHIELHEQDTLAAGDGLCDPAAVRTLVEEGPAAIEQLIAWGAAFDRSGGRLALTREGAHSRNRILHAHGDSTGQEIARTLYREAASRPNIRFRSFSAITDLLLENGEVCGALVFDEATRQYTPARARAVLLASGGLGRVFRDTTNPDIATGDGVAMAYRAGAEISDIEFVQFHPTALHLKNAPRFLLSEAMRGEGAWLRNASGERFMTRYHPLAELAPRDIVSRSMVKEMSATGVWRIYLDLTHLDAAFIRGRFPRIYQTCLRYGLDITAALVPVHPAAHYAMGGVRTDLDGRTSLRRLYAAGEVACTGVHGANRLASNSLLEGVVFGARAGAAMREWAGKALPGSGSAPEARFPCAAEAEVRELAWHQCGILRSVESLETAVRRLSEIAAGPNPEAGLDQHELRNIHTVALLIARCALARPESRGAHYRTDFPEKRPEFQLHSIVSKNHDPSFR
ncbi:MAG: L-aspartate oxidase [Bryobacterales bacterium]|nr:L-aspartate oxidase [Bryobacterales bacterium]